MKRAHIYVLFLLCAICVFGDADNVSLKEGDSVTLHTDVSEKKSSDVIEWRFNGTRIAKISGDTFFTEGPIRDRLQLDNQTGDLKITNIKTTDSGEYKLKISSSTRGYSEKTFTVSVFPADDAGKKVSVTKADTLILHTDVPDIQRYDLIKWRCNQSFLIAELNRMTEKFLTYDGPDEQFKDKLQLDNSTGSLIINSIKMIHFGLYEVDISKSSKFTIHKSFRVTVSDVNKAMSVKKGDSVTLHTGLAEIQTDDLIVWRFRDASIAEKKHTAYVLNGRFRDGLKLDPQTGSLTITNTRPEHAGLYKLQIDSSRCTIDRRFTVNVIDSGSGLSAGAVVGMCVALLVFGALAGAVIYYYRWNSKLQRQMQERPAGTESVPLNHHEETLPRTGESKAKTVAVIEGESVILIHDGINIQKGDIEWKYEDSSIAERRGSNGESTLHEDVLDKKFKGRLLLLKSNGSLKIEDARFTDSGRYELRIIRSGHESVQTFIVCVCDPKNPEEMLLKGLSAQYQ